LMLMFTVASQAMTLKHGVYLSQNLGVSWYLVVMYMCVMVVSGHVHVC
jgi:hypothetical protein